MGKSLHRKNKLHKLPKKWLLLGICAVIGIGGFSGGTLAKYYANNSNKGVTAASNYYFTSNVLAETLTEGEDDWKVVYNTNPWGGSSEYPFEVRIQNYENQLLYNDENLVVEYKITFELLRNDGGIYKVRKGEGESKVLEVNKPVTYEGLEIEGGMANFDDFDVLFKAPDNATEDYQSAEVKVIAEITGPDFLTTTNHKMGGILRAAVVKADYSMKGEYSFDLNTLETEWKDGNLATVNGMAAFPYAISYTPGDDNAAHGIELSWNSSLLQLDRFDEYYSEVRTDETTGTSMLSLVIQPYETIELVFYRGDGFELNNILPSAFEDSLANTEDENNLITIKDLNETE